MDGSIIIILHDFYVLWDSLEQGAVLGQLLAA
jgi:hypothetical protein